MKYALVIPDGCADEPQESLGGRTPLQAAEIPAMDAVAAAGVLGRANNTPPSLPPGSDVANLSLLGYNPLEHFTGRALWKPPRKASPWDRTIGPSAATWSRIEEQVMRDFTAGHISTAEAAALIATLQETLGGERLQFYPGVSYRNLLLVRSSGEDAPFSTDTRTTPAPRSDRPVGVGRLSPRPGQRSLEPPDERERGPLCRAPGERGPPPTGQAAGHERLAVGPGEHARTGPLPRALRTAGAMITAVDLLRGLARLIGWQVIDVPGATGYTDTDYAAKGRYAVEALADDATWCAYTWRPPTRPRTKATRRPRSRPWRRSTGTSWPRCTRPCAAGAHRILVTPDHPTPLRTKTHSHGDVPFALAGSDVRPTASTVTTTPPRPNPPCSSPRAGGSWDTS